MTEEREREEAQKIMEMMGSDGLLRTCIHETNADILETKISLVVRDMFEEELGKVLKDALYEGEQSKQSPIPKMGMLLESLIKANAKVIVMLSSVNPLLLGEKLGLPEDQVRLLRRGIEDHFAELTGQLLKQHILSLHQSFTEFYREKS